MARSIKETPILTGKDAERLFLLAPDADLERAITAEELLIGIKHDLRVKFNDCSSALVSPIL